MTKHPLHTAFVAFLEDPSTENFRAAQRALIDSEEYEPYSNELESVEELVDQERWIDAEEAFRAAMPNLLLSPRAHLVAGMLAEHAEEADRAEFERAIAGLCARAIVETGEGTCERPYIVTRTTDVYDVLGFLGKRPTGQALVGDGNGRHFDQMTLEDGTELWFDITASYTALQASFAPGGDTPHD